MADTFFYPVVNPTSAQLSGFTTFSTEYVVATSSTYANNLVGVYHSTLADDT